MRLLLQQYLGVSIILENNIVSQLKCQVPEKRENKINILKLSSKKVELLSFLALNLKIKYQCKNLSNLV